MLTVARLPWAEAQGFTPLLLRSTERNSLQTQNANLSWPRWPKRLTYNYLRHNGHNTGRVNFENFGFVIDAIREISAELGLRVVPAHLEDLHRNADALGAY